MGQTLLITIDRLFGWRLWIELRIALRLGSEFRSLGSVDLCVGGDSPAWPGN